MSGDSDDIVDSEAGERHRADASPVRDAHDDSEVRERAATPDVYRLIVEQASEAVVFADRSGAIRLWNRGAEKLFGHGAVEALGAHLDLIIPERFRAAHWHGFRRAIETGALRSADLVRVTRSQHKVGSKLYVEMSFALARDDAGAVIGAFAIARDVSDRHAPNGVRPQ